MTEARNLPLLVNEAAIALQHDRHVPHLCGAKSSNFNYNSQVSMSTGSVSDGETFDLGRTCRQMTEQKTIEERSKSSSIVRVPHPHRPRQFADRTLCFLFCAARTALQPRCQLEQGQRRLSEGPSSSCCLKLQGRVNLPHLRRAKLQVQRPDRSFKPHSFPPGARARAGYRRV